MQEKSNGALLGSVIIIIILILGGIYFWKTSMQEKLAPESSESTADMEANLNSIDLDSIDQEI